jgi:thiol-disulfide isomerase/thioredoxin
MQHILDLRRLLLALPVIAALGAALYVFVLRTDDGAGIEAVRLLDTPATAGRAVGVDAGKLAPDFEISSPDGRRVRLSELRGRAVLVNFWATWCGSCLSEMPSIKALQEERGLDAFSVLAVNAGETRAEALEFIDFLDAPFIYGLDSELVLSDAYGVYGLPLSIFIDAEGVVQAVYRGHAEQARLAAYVDAAIGARPPGELPPALRTISTIPRERSLTVEARGSDRVVFSSRSLRCDASYCADPAIEGLRRLAGIASVDTETGGVAPSLSVRFDPKATPQQQVVDHLVAALSALPDPVYEGALEVRAKRP